MADLLRETVRAAAEDGADWRALGEQLGVLGLAVPERWGGSGAGLGEAAVVAEELGAVLASVPFVSTVVAARLLVESGDDAACADLLPGLCDGSRTFAVASLPTGVDRPAGTAEGVVDGPGATDLLVLAGDGLFHVDGAAAEVVPVPTLDLTRPQADITFAETPARRLGPAAPATDVAVTLLAAELVGVARTMLDTAVTYARERVQFGRPIGSFQAVKHRCADMLVELELARSVAEHAARTHDHGGDDPALASSLAHVVATDAARRVTGDAIQVLGGVGITWEHPAHRYYKRAVTSAALWGGRAHRDRLAKLAIDGNDGRSSHAG
ncbi:acyl-CoA dehydrogenase family protein [Actinophytocola gossypii]|uniref:Acyl-CoA/acyl-ACP dehydrogenase n=1 Tax=Actinophytocola gossypii TaxID=2812003 RepID=A0ABT2J6N5_9PSEU|nr:acyl-CoA dehydrogenase family protein [Actinophytocola gossypii]MCT2583528.1 acyl-CoA/acyl-ACP dehydrogenase [Actinophytocola gossypii]